MLVRMQPALLTPSQTAELLDIHVRTLRRYCAVLAVALSPTASRKGRKRFFDGGDIEVLQRAQKLMADGRTLAEIANVVAVRPADEETTALTLSPEANQAVGAIMERTRALTDDVENQDDRLKKLEEWAKQSWWKKLFSSPD